MDNMKKRNNEQEYMKKATMNCLVEQLKLRGENVIKAGKFDRHDLYIKDKDIKIRVKFCKPIKRSGVAKLCWEFTKVIHAVRLFPKDTFDYYMLVGFGDNMVIQKIWKISADDKLIYRKNQVFIPVENDAEYGIYEFKILEGQSNENFKWIE